MRLGGDGDGRRRTIEEGVEMKVVEEVVTADVQEVAEEERREATFHQLPSGRVTHSTPRSALGESGFHTVSINCNVRN